MGRPAIALLKKDLRTTRVLWAPMAFSYGVFLLMFMENVWIYLATGACLAFIAAVTAPGIDDRYQAEPLLAALPGTRRSLVKGRYIAWAVTTAACLAFFLACTALIRAGFGERAPRLELALSVKGAAAFLAGTALTGLVYLPFYFKFGFWRGMWFFTAAGFVLSVAALNVIVRLVPAGVVPAAAAALPAPVASTGGGLRAFAWLIDRYAAEPDVIAAGAGVLALLAFLSYRASAGFYRKRDL